MSNQVVSNCLTEVVNFIFYSCNGVFYVITIVLELKGKLFSFML